MVPTSGIEPDLPPYQRGVLPSDTLSAYISGAGERVSALIEHMDILASPYILSRFSKTRIKW